MAAYNFPWAINQQFLFICHKYLYLYMTFSKIKLSNTDICNVILQQKVLDISRNKFTTSTVEWHALWKIWKHRSKLAQKNRKDILYVICNKV